jgi:hypothetical protein
LKASLELINLKYNNSPEFNWLIEQIYKLKLRQ